MTRPHRTRWWWSSIRFRLAVLYAGAFFNAPSPAAKKPLATRQATDLADIACHTAAEAQPAARAAGVRVRTTLAPAPVAGDPILLERLIHNLVDNAIRYNLPEHGWVHITTACTAAPPRSPWKTPDRTFPPSWQETCTLWDDGRRFAVDVDTSDYPYPLRLMRGLWQVDPDPSGSQVTMRFAYQATPSVRGGLFGRY
jgi:hypothetical protein